MNRRTAHRFAAPLAAVLLILAAIPASAAGEPAGKSIRFLTGPSQGDALDVAQAYITANLDALGLSAADLDDMVVQDRYSTRHNGVTHLYFQQRLDGIDVYNGVINVNVSADGSIINLGNLFVGNLAKRANTGSPSLTDREAIVRAAAHFGLTPTELAPLSTDGGPDLRATFSDPALSRDDIPVRLVYQPLDDGGVRLAWRTVLNLVDSQDWWNVNVDAVSGEVLSRYNWTNYDSYLVFPFPPFSDPDDSGGQILVTDPADATASPFAWHDTDGIAGNEFTDTQGNNVDAHDDLDANNTGGTRADGGATLDFTFPFDPAVQPHEGTNLPAAIVNLFYINNVMHDVTYQYGFDEASGNFQFNNYDNGGLGSDEVEADAQDGSGTNNANFGTPADGSNPRMQMFVWTNPFSQLVTVNPPSSIEGSYIANPSNNGGTGNGLTADLAIVNDGVEPTADGCETVKNDLTGKIGLIVWNQGACNSSVFVANVAAAGGVAAVIVDNTDEPTTSFGGSGSIPSVAVGQSDGNLFIATLNSPENINATLDDNPDPQSTINRDSDNDNGIIAHEYGHGISNRLTGGPGNSNCLGGSEQAGEGWSDFWALVLSAKPGDTPELAKGLGNYASFLPVDGLGIRNFPYTTDLAVNPQTYINIGSTNAPHGVGEIWMDMVWEVYWELVLKHGFDTDLYGGSGGNNLTIQLVVDGMKLQGCLPTFVAARDAILLADMTNNAGANECEIWRGFAKRGLGTGALAGSINAGDETEDFSIPPECPAVAGLIFTDGFESGDTTIWSTTVPLVP